MKIRKLVIASSAALVSSMLIGVSLPISNQVSSVYAVEPTSGLITVDTSSFWGGGLESYKTAVRFYDEGSNEGWSDLVLVEAPDSFIELPYELEFTPTKVDFYRYAEDLSIEDWESDPKSVTPAISSVNLEEVKHFVLTSDSYGLFRYPKITHQIYLEDEETWTSDTDNEYLDSVSLNSSHNAEYSIEIELKEKDYIFFADDSQVFCREFNEDNFILDESVDEGDLSYDEGGLGAGFECKVSGTYIFEYDHHQEKITVLKDVTPVDPSDPADPTEPTEPTDPSGDEPAPTGDEGSGDTEINAKNIFQILAKIFKDAWDDLMAHFKRWFHK